MSQRPPGVLEISNPTDHQICFRLGLSYKFHTARFGKIMVPVRHTGIVVPLQATPLLRKILEPLEDFREDLEQLPLTHHRLDIILLSSGCRLEIVKLGIQACKDIGMAHTIRSRSALAFAA
jgi:hypothetical protein